MGTESLPHPFFGVLSVSNHLIYALASYLFLNQTFSLGQTLLPKALPWC